MPAPDTKPPQLVVQFTTAKNTGKADVTKLLLYACSNAIIPTSASKDRNNYQCINCKVYIDKTMERNIKGTLVTDLNVQCISNFRKS